MTPWWPGLLPTLEKVLLHSMQVWKWWQSRPMQKTWLHSHFRWWCWHLLWMPQQWPEGVSHHTPQGETRLVGADGGADPLHLCSSCEDLPQPRSCLKGVGYPCKRACKKNLAIRGSTTLAIRESTNYPWKRDQLKSKHMCCSPLQKGVSPACFWLVCSCHELLCR